jgi:hypothetical protein
MFAEILTSNLSIMKLFKTISIVFILFISFSCNNEPLEGEFPDPEENACINATQVSVTAATNLANATSENYTELCNTYKTALQTQITACGDAAGALQQIIDSLGDCTDNNQTNDLVGTWLLTAWNVSEALDLNNDDTDSTNLLDEMNCYTNETLVFNQDNTGTAMSTSYAEFEIFIETGTTDAFDFTITCIDEIENTDLTWSQTGNTVTIIDAASSSDWALAGNTLSIVIPEGFSVTDPNDVTITVTQDLTFVYTKQ